jgi:protease-4
MSDENRKQLRVYVNDIYSNYLEDLSKARKITVPELRKLADELSIQTVDDAVEHGLIDTTGYRDNVNQELRTRLGLTKKQKIKAISLAKYTRLTRPKPNYKKKEKVAVVYAEGTILMGSTEPGSIGGENYAKIIRKARKDKNVKAIVLRVNSPGGSMIASEKIWRELSLAKEEGKPVIVSMGNYAASGGYYIACMADTILAEANTLTGSIGVFSMFPNAQKLMNEKLGIRMDTVKTNEYAVGINPIVGLSQKEKDVLQATTAEYYNIFIDRVANGRKMNKDAVKAIAEGRIWTGTRAKELGLVDEIGNLDDAIAIAADMAGLDKYRLAEYPKVKEPLEQYIEQFTGNKVSAKDALIRKEMGDLYPYYRQMKTLQELEGVQARMLFDIKLD